jgi:arylsulfatase A
MCCQKTSKSVLVLTLCLAFCRSMPANEPKFDRPPNIVFILADDLGYRELGSFGQKKIRTPHLDQLATEGMRLTQHYSGNAVCAPSRCVLMTGKHPGHASIRNNSEMQPEGQKPIPSSDVTIAEALKAAGYVCGGFGKWGLGGPGSDGEPLKQGFDRFFGYNCQRHAHSFYPDYLWDDQKKIPLSNRPPVPGHARLPAGADPQDPASYEMFKGTDYAPDRIRDEALKFMTQHRDHPFFLYYPTTLPHVALHVPDVELEPYRALKWNDAPFTAAKGGYTPHFTPRAAYAAMISRMDNDVGRLMAHLKELQLEQNTLVVFSSDNGTTHLADEVDVTFFDSVGSLRGLKGSLYEGGVRVPTIVRWPGRVIPGTQSSTISGFEDWMPTLLGAAGVPDKELPETDGISLIPMLTGQGTIERPFLYREFSAYGGQQSIRAGKWKAVRQGLSSGRVVTELYDMETDVNETTDLAGFQREVVSRLEGLMTTQRVPSAEFPLIPFDRPVSPRNSKKQSKRAKQ